MSLKKDVESLRDATVAGLAAAHDHFVYTKKVWRIVDVEVRRRGRKIVLNNTVTGTRLTEVDVLRVAHASVNEYLPSATIQQIVSLTEIFLTDLVRLWLTAYLMHLKGQIDVQAVVAAPDKPAILRLLVDQYVLSMGYRRPAEWFRQLNAIVMINAPSNPDIDQFAEFKASRDAFVHNRGTASEIYLDKAGTRARAALGQPLDLPDSYLHDGWRLCRKIVTDVGTAAAAKA